jgi:hypothetical protein
VRATATLDDSVKELASRESNGIEVTLPWHPGPTRLTMSVFDAKSGEFFELQAERSRALDVFYHPYAYAAARTAPCPAMNRRATTSLSVSPQRVSARSKSRDRAAFSPVEGRRDA